MSLAVNIAPVEVVAGDAWTLPFVLLAADGTSRPLAAGETVGVELYVASAGATYDLTADVEMTGAAAGVVLVPTAITRGVLPQAPTAWAAAGYPIKLHSFIVDSRGNRTTAGATPILAVDWRTTDLDRVQGATTIVMVVGPAGAQGPAGADDSSVDAIIFG